MLENYINLAPNRENGETNENINVPSKEKTTRIEDKDLSITETTPERQAKIQAVREKIFTGESNKIPTEHRPLSAEERSAYIEKHTPDYLIENNPSLLYRIEQFFGKMAVKNVSGKENLPDGPKLFIANHRGGETPKLIGSLDNPVHIASAEIINWEGSKMVAWAMKKLGMVPIKESFANVPAEKRDEVIKKAGTREKQSHAQAIAETNSPKLGGNVENIRRMTALLLSGRDVAIFAEGPFSRLADDEHRAYAGYALVAREYKKVTGKDLPIIPTGIRGKRVAFGESFTIDQEAKDTKGALENKATEKIHALFNSLD